MEQYRNIPLAPKKRTTVREKFTTLLMFAEKRGLKLAEWVKDPRLEASWKKLVECHPSHSRELDWVSYFLAIIKDASESLPDRKNALAHLKCYYQLTCYWESKKFWEKLYQTNFSGTVEIIWEWEELFENAMATFECLEKAQNDLRNFQPHLGLKQFIKQVFFYNFSNWRDKKIGRDTKIGASSLDASLTGDSPDNKNCFSRQKEIEEVIMLNQNLQKDFSSSKKQQERVLALFESELEKIETELEKDRKSKKGKANLRLWIFLVLIYGFNLRQIGATEVLNSNKISLNQATISRTMKTFICKLQLQLVKEFKREIKDVLGDLENDEKEPVENRIKNWAENHKKEINDILKELLEKKVFTLAVMPQKQQLKEIEPPRDGLVRQELDAWCDRSLQISINSEILSEKSNEKIEQLVRKFVAKLGINQG